MFWSKLLNFFLVFPVLIFQIYVGVCRCTKSNFFVLHKKCLCCMTRLSIWGDKETWNLVAKDVNEGSDFRFL